MKGRCYPRHETHITTLLEIIFVRVKYLCPYSASTLSTESPRIIFTSDSTSFGKTFHFQTYGGEKICLFCSHFIRDNFNVRCTYSFMDPGWRILGWSILSIFMQFSCRNGLSMILWLCIVNRNSLQNVFFLISGTIPSGMYGHLSELHQHPQICFPAKHNPYPYTSLFLDPGFWVVRFIILFLGTKM